MSGGSMDYLYLQVQSANFRLHTPLRRAFKEHLELVANALHSIEWVDSDDRSDGDEDDDIRAVLHPGSELKHLTKEALQAAERLDECLKRSTHA